MEYELFYLIGASKEAEMEKIKKEAEGIVEKSGGKFLEKTTIEKRRLSYEVKHETHGIYIARRFELEESGEIGKITKILNLSPNILRFIISKAEDLPELKSKEERMAEQTRTNADNMRITADKQVKAAKKAKEEKLDKKEDVVDSTEKAGGVDKDGDIDKKLEEILNI